MHIKSKACEIMKRNKIPPHAEIWIQTLGYRIGKGSLVFRRVGIVSRGNVTGECPVVLSTIQLIIARATVFSKNKMDGYDWTAGTHVLESWSVHEPL
jgi:hypothetical protein